MDRDTEAKFTTLIKEALKELDLSGKQIKSSLELLSQTLSDEKILRNPISITHKWPDGRIAIEDKSYFFHDEKGNWVFHNIIYIGNGKQTSVYPYFKNEDGTNTFNNKNSHRYHSKDIPGLLNDLRRTIINLPKDLKPAEKK